MAKATVKIKTKSIANPNNGFIIIAIMLPNNERESAMIIEAVSRESLINSGNSSLRKKSFMKILSIRFHNISVSIIPYSEQGLKTADAKRESLVIGDSPH